MENQANIHWIKNIGNSLVGKIEINFTSLTYYCSKCHNVIGYKKPNSDFQCQYYDLKTGDICMSTEYEEYEKYHTDTIYDKCFNDIWNEIK